MHENHIAKAILETALKASPKKSSKIKMIRVSAGALSGIEEESINAHFQEIAKGTPAEKAKIMLKKADDLSRAGLEILVEEITVES